MKIIKDSQASSSQQTLIDLQILMLGVYRSLMRCLQVWCDYNYLSHHGTIVEYSRLYSVIICVVLVRVIPMCLLSSSLLIWLSKNCTVTNLEISLLTEYGCTSIRIRKKFTRGSNHVVAEIQGESNHVRSTKCVGHRKRGSNKGESKTTTSILG
jgi:hypothetical protein